MDTGKGRGKNVKRNNEIPKPLVAWSKKNETPGIEDAKISMSTVTSIIPKYANYMLNNPITSTNCVTILCVLITFDLTGPMHSPFGLFDNLDICHRKFFEQHRLKFEAVFGWIPWNPKNQMQQTYTHNLGQDQHPPLKTIPKLANFLLVWVGGWGGWLSGQG